MFKNVLKNDESTTRNIENLSEIVDHYDCYLIDLWGVMHNGKESFPKAVQAVNSLLSLNKKVIFLSNMPRPKELVFKKMWQDGVKDGFEVLTSGDCTVEKLLKSYSDKTIFHMGENVNKDILANHNFKTTDHLNEANLVLLTLFVDRMQGYEEAISLCEQIARKNIFTVCANPDKEAFNGTIKRLTAGFFAKKIEEFGGEIDFIGKPFLNIYNTAFKKFNISPENNKIVMVGDTIQTDIVGAYNAGIDSVLVRTGVTQSTLNEENEALDDYCLKNALPTASYITNRLAL